MYIFTEEQALKHFGIKGMRWGVRRKRGSGGRVGGGGKKGSSSTVTITEQDVKRTKQIVAAAVAAYGAVKLGSFAVERAYAKAATIKYTNEIANVLISTLKKG